MASPTGGEILEIFEELNYPSASKLRAAFINRGFRARLQDVEAFVKSQTPTQLFAKAPTYQGKIVATRPNERWVIDFIDFTAALSQNFKYIFRFKTSTQEKCGPTQWKTTAATTTLRR